MLRTTWGFSLFLTLSFDLIIICIKHCDWNIFRLSIQATDHRTQRQVTLNYNNRIYKISHHRSNFLTKHFLQVVAVGAREQITFHWVDFERSRARQTYWKIIYFWGHYVYGHHEYEVATERARVLCWYREVLEWCQQSETLLCCQHQEVRIRSTLSTYM